VICVTGNERTVAALRARQERTSGADFQELRLDQLEDPTTPVEALATGASLARLVVACRPAREGGGFEGDEALRVELLGRAARAGVGFVDLEADVDPASASAVIDAASRGQTRVIRSIHINDVVSGVELASAARRRMDALRALRGNVLKLAVAVGDAADLAVLRELGRERDRAVLLIGMGPAGVLSRACANRFGSAWTYAAADDASRTAAGQLTYAEAMERRLGGGADPAPVALLGGPQVHGSPGPVVHNRLFARRRVPWVYVPVETTRLEATWALLRSLGARAASVTMPHKAAATALVEALDPSAATVGAINTIATEGGVLRGANTDGIGAARAIAAVRPAQGATALVLGAGATARAVASALARQGARVLVWNRTAGRARELAAAVAGALPGAVVEPVERVADAPFDVLVNATSLGLGGDGADELDRLLEGVPLSGAVVLDCVAQPRRTRLLERAGASGATTIGGLEMWLHQAAAQATRWLGREVDAAELRALLPGSS
jgi:shikimate dehydrogenase/3-dehydroquinate dehydratase type I